MFEFDKKIPSIPENALLIGALDSLEECSIRDLQILHDLIVDYFGSNINPNYPIENVYNHNVFKYNQGKFFLIDEKYREIYLKKITNQIVNQRLKSAFLRAIKKFSKQI